MEAPAVISWTWIYLQTVVETTFMAFLLAQHFEHLVMKLTPTQFVHKGSLQFRSPIALVLTQLEITFKRMNLH